MSVALSETAIATATKRQECNGAPLLARALPVFVPSVLGEMQKTRETIAFGLLVPNLNSAASTRLVALQVVPIWEGTGTRRRRTSSNKSAQEKYLA